MHEMNTCYSSFMIDSHCHLADTQFDDDFEDVLRRAKAAGVERMICIADDMEESKKCLEIAEKYEQIFCTLGVHPHQASSFDSSIDIDDLRTLAQSSIQVKALGEMGLDYYYDNSPRAVQCDVFLAQLQLAKELDLPAVVHCREAMNDLTEIIEEVDPPALVVHCCTEPWETVEPLVLRGYFLSFTGIATSPKSHEIRETIRRCPMHQLMIETDAPYLSPVPHRGKRNEPAYVHFVAQTVAEAKGMTVEEVDSITTRNAEIFFGL